MCVAGLSVLLLGLDVRVLPCRQVGGDLSPEVLLEPPSVVGVSTLQKWVEPAETSIEPLAVGRTGNW